MQANFIGFTCTWVESLRIFLQLLRGELRPGNAVALFELVAHAVFNHRMELGKCRDWLDKYVVFVAPFGIAFSIPVFCCCCLFVVVHLYANGYNNNTYLS